MNQFIKGFNPNMAVNSYLNDDVEGEQFYFSFGSFSTRRSLNLDPSIWQIIFPRTNDLYPAYVQAR